MGWNRIRMYTRINRAEVKTAQFQHIPKGDDQLRTNMSKSSTMECARSVFNLAHNAEARSPKDPRTFYIRAYNGDTTVKRSDQPHTHSQDHNSKASQGDNSTLLITRCPKGILTVEYHDGEAKAHGEVEVGHIHRGRLDIRSQNFEVVVGSHIERWTAPQQSEFAVIYKL